MDGSDSRSDEVPSGTVTSSELLEGLRDPANETLWGQYVDRYRPTIVRTGRRWGLTEADAEDVAQTSLLEFSRSYAAGEYRRARGRLRDWLFGIVRNRIRGQRRLLDRPGARGRGAAEDSGPLDGDGSPPDPAAPDDFARIWEEEWTDAVVRQCMSIVRAEVSEQTYAAFRAYVVDGKTAGDVAAELGIGVDAVYEAKRRTLRRLQELRPLFDESW